jgi:hypothetical protein
LAAELVALEVIVLVANEVLHDVCFELVLDVSDDVNGAVAVVVGVVEEVDRGIGKPSDEVELVVLEEAMPEVGDCETVLDDIETDELVTDETLELDATELDMRVEVSVCVVVDSITDECVMVESDCELVVEESENVDDVGNVTSGVWYMIKQQADAPCRGRGSYKPTMGCSALRLVLFRSELGNTAG